MREIKEKDIVLARHIKEEDCIEGLNFFSQDEEFIQVGTWGYNKGKKLLAHIHNEVERKVYWTQEVLFIKKGSIKVRIYDTKAQFLEEFIAQAGDILVMLKGGHGYDILEDGTKVVEIKNGPYVGADLDRRRIECAIIHL
ncbi:hypothetical protein DMB95_02030 [Campylobacter sp. MIT 12-8780]|uniref:hypothetical protein n=1 Tax=unclassified Campylobacter TaxID=2593542 RepID=UPI00115F6533|nr:MULTISPECIES: hypothetical protein [unclassified Campylobacter]NDJ26758.1 hypothetical protein [Campylobacter sp. MIT 19-121]TQR42417.1 hypothetical protein DMB95_02030 [Campylobacter sp. MIT 12-8780]